MSNYLATYGKPRYLGIIPLTDEEHELVAPGRLVVAQSHRGEELAEIVGAINEEQEAEYRSLRTIVEHGEGPVRGGDPVVTDMSFVRVATDEDIDEQAEFEAGNLETLRAAREYVVSNKLDVKLVDAEMLPGRKKLFFYFTADTRVDFRTLVKDLARHFRTRIELRQIGVRDEARIIRGLSSCGLPCCCSYWLNHLTPIGIKMVKEQNIALNPAKISGICGRLMCCMAFEHKTYRDLWADMPAVGSKIKAPQGNYIVAQMDITREAVRCHKPSGGDIAVPIRLFQEFREAVLRGEEWEVPEDAISDYDRRKHCAECKGTYASDMFDLSRFERQSETSEAEQRDPADGEHRRRKRRGRRGGHKREDGSAARPQQARPKGQDMGPRADVSQGHIHDADQGDGAVPKRPRRRRRPSHRPESRSE